MDREQFIEELKKLNIKLDIDQELKLERFYTLLIDWNTKINLTRIIEKNDVYLKHFYDSLTIVKAIDLNNIETLCDIGTGAGFPGIVLKIVFPHLKITLVDSLLKRVKYLNSIIEDLKLENINVIHARGEELKGEYDLVTARAVANIEKLLNYTMHLVKKDGYFVAMKGNITEELDENVKKKISKKYKIVSINEFLLPYENSCRNLIKIQNKK